MHKASGSDRQIIALPYLITFSTAPGLFCSCLAVLAKCYLSGNNSEASPENCTAKSYLRKIYFYRRQELQQQIYLVFKLLSGSWACRKRWGSPGIGLWEEAALSWDLDEVQVKSPSQKKYISNHSCRQDWPPRCHNRGARAQQEGATGDAPYPVPGLLQGTGISSSSAPLTATPLSFGERSS